MLSNESILTLRRSRGLLLATILAAAFLIGCDRQGHRLPSLVFITIDTIRADHLGCYGYYRDTSPNLDRFAEEALLFERAVTPIATTLPAHASLFTSRYPMETGIVSNGKRIRGQGASDIRFLAEILSDLDYDTAAFVSATPLRRRSGIGTGFAHHLEPPRGDGQKPANWMTEAVLRWLERRQAGGDSRPLLLWVHYFDPHLPHEPPPPFDTRFEADEELVRTLRNRGFDHPREPRVPRDP